MRTFFVFCVALGAGCFLVAQTTTPSTPSDSPALASPSGKGQTKIDSDNGGEFYYKIKTYIYRGNVRVDNPDMKLKCELLTIESPEVAEGKYYRATAETNVVIDWVDESGTNHATAAKAVYTYTLTNLATLPEVRWQTNAIAVLSGGNPVMTGNRGMIKGDPINWDRLNGVISTPNVLQTVISNNASQIDSGMPKTNRPAK